MSELNRKTVVVHSSVYRRVTTVCVPVLNTSSFWQVTEKTVMKVRKIASSNLMQKWKINEVQSSCYAHVGEVGEEGRWPPIFFLNFISGYWKWSAAEVRKICRTGNNRTVPPWGEISNKQMAILLIQVLRNQAMKVIGTIGSELWKLKETLKKQDWKFIWKEVGLSLCPTPDGRTHSKNHFNTLFLRGENSKKRNLLTIILAWADKKHLLF